MTFIKHTFSFIGGLAVAALVMIVALIVKIIVSAFK